jgi:hypothetical protein
MSNYRTVYRDQDNDRKVLTSIVNDNTTVTTSNEKFIIDTIQSTIDKLSSWGIDVSYFWKHDLADHINPASGWELDISNHPSNANVTRKAFVDKLAIDYSENYFRINIIVRHFIDGVHQTDENYDDEYVSRIVDNSVLVDDGQGGQIGEYDFFFQLVNAGTFTLFELQQARIPIMDSNNIFDNIYG